MKHRKHEPLTPQPKDVGRRVIFTGGVVSEEGVLARLIDEPPDQVMVSFGGCAPEPVDKAKLRWGKGRG